MIFANVDSMKSLLFIMLLLIASGFVFSASYSGTGDYSLYINDSVSVPSGLTVVLSNVGYSYSQTQEIQLQNATFQFLRGGDVLYSRTLLVGDRYTYSLNSSGTRNATVRLDSLTMNSSSAATYLLTRPYATVRITSAYSEPTAPIIPIRVVSFTAFLEEHSISTALVANASANATIYYSHNSTIYTISSSIPRETHYLNLTSLKSNTEYKVWAVVCSENFCNQSENFTWKTRPVYPRFYNITAKSITDTSARITWVTDILSDSKVFYRSVGSSSWAQIPPPNIPDPRDFDRYYVVPDLIPGAPGYTNPKTNPGTIIVPSAKTKEDSRAFFDSPRTSFAPIVSGVKTSVSSGSYSINSDLFDQIGTDLSSSIAKYIVFSHSVNLDDLDDNTTYQYMVSGCADICVNSSIHTFKTNLSLFTPSVFYSINPSMTIDHGSSATINFNIKSQNPSGKIVSAKIFWSDGGMAKSMDLKFGSDPRSPLTNAKPNNALVNLNFEDSGEHNILVSVKDDYNLTTDKSFKIIVKPKTTCTSTNSVYYPSDTICNDDWPSGGGPGVKYNNEIGSCNAFEVCSDSLDYLNQDAQMCCNGIIDQFSSEPTKNRGYDYSKTGACDQAIADTRAKNPLTSLGADATMKFCKAAYLVRSIGSYGVYMKDYYTAEACCKDASFCGDYPRYQAYHPWPAANIKFNQLWCYYTDWGIFGKSPKDGWYGSDTNPESNNNALADFPAHASVNTMNTGTCVDYSFVVTTALRKAGFKKNEILSMRTPGHLYNVVWLPGDSKYSFIDTVGNTGGDFFTGPGWGWKSGGKEVNHCSYNSDRCSNDNGPANCPAKSDISGC